MQYTKPPANRAAPYYSFFEAVSCLSFQNWSCPESCPFILQLFCAFGAFSTCLISVLILLVGFTWHDHSSFEVVRTLCNPSKGESVYRGSLNWFALWQFFLLSSSAFSKLTSGDHSIISRDFMWTMLFEFKVQLVQWILSSFKHPHVNLNLWFVSMRNVDV